MRYSVIAPDLALFQRSVVQYVVQGRGEAEPLGSYEGQWQDMATPALVWPPAIADAYAAVVHVLASDLAYMRGANKTAEHVTTEANTGDREVAMHLRVVVDAAIENARVLRVHVVALMVDNGNLTTRRQLGDKIDYRVVLGPLTAVKTVTEGFEVTVRGAAAPVDAAGLEHLCLRRIVVTTGKLTAKESNPKFDQFVGPGDRPVKSLILAELLEWIGRSTRLRTLCIDGLVAADIIGGSMRVCPLIDRGDTPLAQLLSGELFRKDSPLRVLVLAGIGLTADIIDAIPRIKHPLLQVLSVANNPALGEPGCERLVHHLFHGGSLHCISALQLQGCGLRGGARFAEMLEEILSFDVLYRLDLSRNPITEPETWRVIGRALADANYASLYALDVSNTRLDDVALVDLLPATTPGLASTYPRLRFLCCANANVNAETGKLLPHVAHEVAMLAAAAGTTAATSADDADPYSAVRSACRAILNRVAEGSIVAAAHVRVAESLLGMADNMNFAAGVGQSAIDTVRHWAVAAVGDTALPGVALVAPRELSSAANGAFAGAWQRLGSTRTFAALCATNDAWPPAELLADIGSGALAGRVQTNLESAVSLLSHAVLDHVPPNAIVIESMDAPGSVDIRVARAQLLANFGIPARPQFEFRVWSDRYVPGRGLPIAVVDRPPRTFTDLDSAINAVPPAAQRRRIAPPQPPLEPLLAPLLTAEVLEPEPGWLEEVESQRAPQEAAGGSTSSGADAPSSSPSEDRPRKRTQRGPARKEPRRQLAPAPAPVPVPASTSAPASIEIVLDLPELPEPLPGEGTPSPPAAGGQQVEQEEEEEGEEEEEQQNVPGVPDVGPTSERDLEYAPLDLDLLSQGFAAENADDVGNAFVNLILGVNEPVEVTPAVGVEAENYPTLEGSGIVAYEAPPEVPAAPPARAPMLDTRFALAFEAFEVLGEENDDDERRGTRSEASSSSLSLRREGNRWQNVTPPAEASVAPRPAPRRGIPGVKSRRTDLNID
jgi:hypothetical protein